MHYDRIFIEPEYIRLALLIVVEVIGLVLLTVAKFLEIDLRIILIVLFGIMATGHVEVFDMLILLRYNLIESIFSVK